MNFIRLSAHKILDFLRKKHNWRRRFHDRIRRREGRHTQPPSLAPELLQPDTTGAVDTHAGVQPTNKQPIEPAGKLLIH